MRVWQRYQDWRRERAWNRLLRDLPPVVAHLTREDIQAIAHRDLGRPFDPLRRSDRDMLQCGVQLAIHAAMMKAFAAWPASAEKGKA